MLLENLYCIWPNDQFCCLHWTTNEIKQYNWRKAARIDKSKRCCIPLWQCKAIHIFGHSAKIIGAWEFCHIHHIVLTLHHPITFCFDLYKTPRIVKISITMMISNRTWFSFLLIKTRSFMNVGLWCCLKDGKRSLIKMGNLLQNKVIEFHKKIVFDFLKKIRNYLVANLILSITNFEGLPIWRGTLALKSVFPFLCIVSRDLARNHLACTFPEGRAIVHSP